MDPPLKPKDGTTSVLENIPAEVFSEILDRCDYPSIQSLRKTSSKIRDFIDTALPKCSILKLLITILLDTVVLQIHVSNSDLPYPTGGLLYLTYKDKENGARISSNFRASEIQIPGEHFENLAISDFLEVLKIQGKNLEVLEILEIQQESGSSNSKFLKFLAEKNLKIPAKTLKMKVWNSTDILKILKVLNSKFLKKLVLERPEDLEESHIFLGLLENEDWRKNEQWMALEELDSPDYQFSYDVRDYLHLKKVNTELSVISWRNMDTLKENILSAGPEKHFRLNYNHFHDRDQFPRHFGAHLKDDDENAFFFYRTNKNEQLMKMSIFGNFIEFKWISPHEMSLEGLPFIQEYQIPEKRDYWKLLRDLRYIF
ncbi:unnamed protein product [Caenorhabditis nigoni]